MNKGESESRDLAVFFQHCQGRGSKSENLSFQGEQRKYIIVVKSLGLESDRPGFNLKSITL